MEGFSTLLSLGGCYSSIYPLKKIEGLSAWAKSDVTLMCIVKTENWIPSAIRRSRNSKDFSPRFFNRQIYEPTKIYNSINRAKIINSISSLYPETISVTHSIVRQHAFHISLSLRRFLISSLDNPTDESSETTCKSQLEAIIVNLSTFFLERVLRSLSCERKLWGM